MAKIRKRIPSADLAVKRQTSKMQSLGSWVLTSIVSRRDCGPLGAGGFLVWGFLRVGCFSL